MPYRVTLQEQFEQASVLDTLPDAIIIANKQDISYLNQEGWKFLKCQSAMADVVDMASVFCIDAISCAAVRPVEQLIKYLCEIEGRLKNIPKSNFLNALIEMATDETIMLQFYCSENCPDDNNEA